MSDPLLLGSIAAILGAAALLKAWNGWLRLKRIELASRPAPDGSPFASARIELADLKERVRRLEAITEGSDPRK